MIDCMTSCLAGHSVTSLEWDKTRYFHREGCIDCPHSTDNTNNLILVIQSILALCWHPRKQENVSLLRVSDKKMAFPNWAMQMVLVSGQQTQTAGRSFANQKIDKIMARAFSCTIKIEQLLLFLFFRDAQSELR